MEYRLSTYRTYLLNQFKEGYKFVNEKMIPPNWVEFIYIFENVHLIFPSVVMRFTDLAGLTDLRPLTGLCVILGLEDKRTRFFDFSIMRCDGKRIDDVRRPMVGSLTVYGGDILSLWLKVKKSSSYGEKSASELVESLADIIVEDYRVICPFVLYDKRVVPSMDRFRYFQAGNSYANFFSYLRNVARSSVEKDGYLLWFQRYSDEDGRWRLGFRFLTVETLRRSPVKWEFEYVLDTEKFEKAFENDGTFEKGRVPVLWLSVDGGGRQDVILDRLIDVRWFDIEKLKLNRRVMVLKDYSGGFGFGLDEFSWSGSKNYFVTGSWVDRLNWMMSVSPFIRAKMNRKIYVVIPGNSRLQLGDKVRVKVPSGTPRALDMYRFVTGEWIVMGITHFVSGQGRHYLQKVTLVSDEYKTVKVGA